MQTKASEVPVSAGAALGFYSQQHHPSPTKLNVQGTLPAWLKGDLFRTGPGRYDATSEHGPTLEVEHWFDGRTQNHRFVIDGELGEVTYLSQDASSELDKRSSEAGEWLSIGFGQSEPCKTIFAKFFSAFRPASSFDHPENVNVGVTVDRQFPGAAAALHAHGLAPVETVVAKTDSNKLQALNASDLKPIVTFDYTTLSPDLTGPLSAAHGAYVDSCFYDFVLELGGQPKYKVFSVQADGSTRILHTITDAPPAYLHSLAATDRFVILSIWQSDFAWKGAKIMWDRNILDAIRPWDPNRETIHYVIDRHNGAVHGKFETPAMFCFHHINAYDEGDEVVLDLAAYDDNSVMYKLRLDNLRRLDGKAFDFPRAHASRYTLNIKTGTASISRPVTTDNNIELPVVSPKVTGKRHRYSYGIHRTDERSGQGSLTDSIIKIDHDKNTSTVWHENHWHPGEPIFVPQSSESAIEEEDTGVLLTLALNSHKRASALIVLDARTMAVRARAEMTFAAAYGFHGTFHRAC